MTNRQAETNGTRRSSKALDSRLSSSHQFHSSQDSLATSRTGSTSLMHPASMKSYSCVSSRRSSRDEAPISSTSSLTMKTASNEATSMESNVSLSKRSSPSAISSKNSSTANIEANLSSRVDSSSCFADSTKEVDLVNHVGKHSNEKGYREDQKNSHKTASKTISRTNSIASDKSVSTLTNPHVVDETKKWSTLEKKWSSSMDKTGNKATIQSGDTKNKIAQFAMNSDKNNQLDINKSIERPRDLSFSSAFSGQANMKMSPGSGTPSAKNIRQMTERWEERSNSVESSSLITPTNSSAATTPTPALSFSRRSTQDKLLTPTTNTSLNQETASKSIKVKIYFY